MNVDFDGFPENRPARNPQNRRHPFSALLGMIACGLLCGAPDVQSHLGQMRSAQLAPARRHRHNGVPLAMRTYSGEKNDCKLPVSQTLLKQAAPLLANALYTQKNGTDYHRCRGQLRPRAQRQPGHSSRAGQTKARLSSCRLDFRHRVRQ